MSSGRPGFENLHITGSTKFLRIRIPSHQRGISCPWSSHNNLAPTQQKVGKQRTTFFLCTIIHLYSKIHGPPPRMPLEKEDKNNMKENNAVETHVGKPPSPTPLSVQHVLHGGIGTYSISHISCFNSRMQKPEGPAFLMAPGVSISDRNDENSNCSSYTAGSNFTLWEETSTRKGKTREENLGDLNVSKEPMVKTGQWTTDQPSESSSNHQNSFSTQSSSQPPAQKNQSFREMLNSAAGPCAKEEHEDEGFTTLRKESTYRTGDLRVKVDGKVNHDQTANTPRSKHSATEQRRRCKINDRFQMLRELIPHSDQKRDKASFLMEVIEYIQFLQEKVSRYEGSYPGWSSEPTTLTPWRSDPKQEESVADQPQNVNGQVLMFKSDDKNNVITSTVLKKQQNPEDPALKNPIMATTIPIPLQAGIAGIFPSIRSNNADAMQTAPPAVASDTEDASLPRPQLWQKGVHSYELVSSKSSQELAIESGTISISSMYSQGLLNTLTQALRSSGVDLSQASISLQVDIGKRANHSQSSQRTIDDKNFEIDCNNHALIRERVESSGLDESNQANKRLKMANN